MLILDARDYYQQINIMMRQKHKTHAGSVQVRVITLLGLGHPPDPRRGSSEPEPNAAPLSCITPRSICAPAIYILLSHDYSYANSKYQSIHLLFGCTQKTI